MTTHERPSLALNGRPHKAQRLGANTDLKKREAASTAAAATAETAATAEAAAAAAAAAAATFAVTPDLQATDTTYPTIENSKRAAAQRLMRQTKLALAACEQVRRDGQSNSAVWYSLIVATYYSSDTYKSPVNIPPEWFPHLSDANEAAWREKEREVQDNPGNFPAFFTFSNIV